MCHVLRSADAMPRCTAALFAVLLASACAISTYQLPTTAGDAERHKCEEFAEARSASVGTTHGSGGGGFARHAREGMRMVPWPYFPVVALIVGVVGAIEEAHESGRARQSVYDTALEMCLEPTLLAQRPDTKPAAIARSLARVARAYAGLGPRYTSEAESHYRRALALYETALGPYEDQDAWIFGDYAAFLLETGRQTDGQQMKATADGIQMQLDTLPHTD